MLQFWPITFLKVNGINNLINGLNDVRDNDKWYEKFNPIKILIPDVENNSNNSIIHSIE